jgi:hypothetical protein
LGATEERADHDRDSSHSACRGAAGFDADHRVRSEVVDAAKREVKLVIRPSCDMTSPALMPSEHHPPLVVAGVLALAHFLSPYVVKLRPKLEPQLSSLAGGFAIAYVCLELIPSLGTEHDLVGRRIYFVILVGFTFFFGLRVWIHHQRKRIHYERVAYGVRFAGNFLFSVLLAIAMTRTAPDSILVAVIFAALMGVHLLADDLAIADLYPERFEKYGRFVMMAAIAIGMYIGVFGDPSEVATDLVAAFLTGLVLYQAFREDLPPIDKARFTEFFAGAFFFAVMHLALVKIE